MDNLTAETEGIDSQDNMFTKANKNKEEDTLLRDLNAWRLGNKMNNYSQLINRKRPLSSDSEEGIETFENVLPVENKVNVDPTPFGHKQEEFSLKLKAKMRKCVVDCNVPRTPSVLDGDESSINHKECQLNGTLVEHEETNLSPTRPVNNCGDVKDEFENLRISDKKISQSMNQPIVSGASNESCTLESLEERLNQIHLSEASSHMLDSDDDSPVLDMIPVYSHFKTSGKTPAQELKENGNAQFKAGNYTEAIKFYSLALTYDSKDPILYGNRAQAYIKVQQYQKAIVDCDIALSFDRNYVKALFRRAVAKIQRGDFDMGKMDLLLLAKLEPNNKEAKQLLADLKERMTKTHPRKGKNITHENSRRRLSQRKTSIINTKSNSSIESLKSQASSTRRFISPVLKEPGERSTRPLLRIPVRIVNEPESVETREIPSCQSADLEKTRSVCLEIPPVATTIMQFCLDWRILIDCPERAALYLQKMRVEDFNIFEKASIDYNVLAEIIDTLVWEFRPRKWDFAVQLEGLTRISRFGTLILLMAEKEKAALRVLIAECEKSSVRDFYLANYNLS